MANPSVQELPEFTFENVTITLSAASAAEAYNKLCELLAVEPDLEFVTDSFSGPGFVNEPTDSIWPCECGRARVMCATFDDEEAEHADRYFEADEADEADQTYYCHGCQSPETLESSSRMKYFEHADGCLQAGRAWDDREARYREAEECRKIELAEVTL